MTSQGRTANLDIAVVVSATNLHPKSNYMATFDRISSAVASDNRYSGSRVTAVAWDAPHDWSRYSHILLSSGIDYSHCRQQFLDWMNTLPECIKTRLFNPPNVIQWNIDKIYLLNYKSKGVRIPPSVFIRPGETPNFTDVMGLLEQQINQQSVEVIVLKNMVDAGGHSVHLASLQEPIDASVIYNKALEAYSQSGVVIQQFFPAIQTEGEWSLIYFDRKFSHAVLKTPGPGGFKVQNRFGGQKTPIDSSNLPKDIVRFATEVMDATEGDPLLYARVDIVRNPDGLPCLMEFEAFEPNLYISNNEIATHFLQALCNY